MADDKDQAVAEKRRIIIDADTGADDASAIILAAKTPGVEIVGITIVAGNTGIEQNSKNALMALEVAGADVPVYKGTSTASEETIKTHFSVFGSDGMGDAGLINPKGKVQEGDAVDFILNTVRAHPGEIEIVALGPASNIARAIKTDPDTMAQVKRIWSMGTTGLGPGNASPVAEFNVYADPEAYKVMLDSGLPITIVGLDMCGGEAQWTNSQFESLKRVGAPGQFIAASFQKLREFYQGNGSSSVMNCDALAMMCALSPDFVKEYISCHGSCITDAGETRGQVLFYRKGFTYDNVANDFNYNVSLVSKVDSSTYFDRMAKAIAAK